MDTGSQRSVLEEANAGVKREAYYMKQSLDRGTAGIEEALKHAANMLGELRVSTLSPQNYYNVYIAATDELRYLQQFLEDEYRKDASLNLYEVVQYCGNIIPRLYLLCTVGSVYISQGISPPMDVLFDLVELCKGVQHPTRGLFLRSYLAQVARERLPETGDEAQMQDAIRFLIQNFGDVNRLWVRMQHQGSLRERPRREKERQNLRMLVGTNLVRLSNLEGITKEIYATSVLPQVLELIVECKDRIAQEYLMECIIQVFPDEFHLETLQKYMEALQELGPKVDIKHIIISMMNRLSTYASNAAESIPSGMDLFSIFQEYSSKAMAANTNMTTKDVLSLQVALLNFASKVYPDRMDYLDSVLKFAKDAVERKNEVLTDDESRSVVKLLTTPLQAVGIRVFELLSYSPLMQYLEFDLRRQVASAVAKAIIASHTPISDIDTLSTVCDFLSPLLKKQGDVADDYTFRSEQHFVAQLVHLVYHKDTDQHYALLLHLRNEFAEGGEQRFPHTLPSLVLCALRLGQRILEREKSEQGGFKVKSKKIFSFVHKVTTVLSPLRPNMALRLFLQAALCSDQAQHAAISYEFLLQVFMIYEEELADSKERAAAVRLVIGVLQQIRNMEEEDYDTMSTQATQHAARMLKKEDKARFIAECSYMFWTGDGTSGTRKGASVLACLKRSLKVANAVMDDCIKASLFCEILERYLYFLDQGVEEISVENVKDLVQLIQSTIADAEEPQEVRALFHRVKESIRVRSLEPSSRCAAIEV